MMFALSMEGEIYDRQTRNDRSGSKTGFIGTAAGCNAQNEWGVYKKSVRDAV